jgi:hypothetical protein
MESSAAEAVATLPTKTILIGPDKIGANCSPDYILKQLGLPVPSPPEGLKSQYGHALQGRLLTCTVDVALGASVKAHALENYIFVESATGNSREGRHLNTWGWELVEVPPFISVQASGKSYHKTVEIEVHNNTAYWVASRKPEKTVLDSYGGEWDYRNRITTDGIPWNYLKVRVTSLNDPDVSIEAECKFPRPEAGLLDLDALSPTSTTFRASNTFFGMPLSWEETLNNRPDHHSDDRWPNAWRLLKNFEIKQGKAALWKRFLDMYEDRSRLSKGVKATEAKKGIRENLALLKKEEPLLASFYAWLHDEKTREGVANNTLLAAFLEARGTDYEVLKTSLTEAMEESLQGLRPSGRYRTDGLPENRTICLALPGAKDKDEERRSKKEWYLKKNAKEQAISLGVTETAHPKLLKAIEEQRLPLSLFHKAGDQLSLVNVEFDLWERAFEREGILADLAKGRLPSARRSTYEKNVTPYIAFLFRIEGYLTRHTGKGKKWRSIPKFVKSEYELEMNEADDGGTTKRRSALTPVPDNTTRTISVPYCAMAISGVRTTYCYSLDYQVFEEDTIDRESGTPIVNELEFRLNGRDDYGLMYFTLTGTSRNTGYPAFLIIFERRKSGTHVHFHRVHPCRSKEGKPTPACRLVEECYRYMAGNIRAEEIYAQQGDLIFLKTEQTVEIPVEAKAVKEFESHAFKPLEDKAILLIPNETKSIKNRLGFIYSEGMFMVDHPEHEPIKGIPAGMYEVRRCKSYENNPSGVWVLNID